MSFHAVSFFATSAKNIEELADRLYIHPNVSAGFSTTSINKWYENPAQTSTDLALYLSKEKNREKIAVLLEFLGKFTIIMDYEKAYLKAYKATNLEALVDTLSCWHPHCFCYHYQRHPRPRSNPLQ